MNNPPRPQTAKTQKKRAALAERLREIDREIEELTDGRVGKSPEENDLRLMLLEAREKLGPKEIARGHSAEMQMVILNALPAQIALLNTKGVILAVNEAWCRFASANLLQSDDFFVGQNYLGVCENAHGDCAEEARAVADGIRSVLQGKSGEFSLEYPCHSPTEKRWFRLMVMSLSEHRTAGAVVMHVNVTERKKIEAQYYRAQRMEIIGSLAGGIAHDLNNVLAPIIMAIGLLKKEERDPRSLETLKMIEDSAKRGTEMVKQVLSFGRGVENRQMDIRIDRLIREIGKIVHETFLKHIDVRTEIPSNLWRVRGDPTQLHQIILNLCVNARDAMPDGGTLTLLANNLVLDEQYAGMHLDAEPGPHVCIEVKDNGTGMPPEVIDRIFDPFFTTKDLDKGTGLGLPTSVAILKSHGGFLRVFSEVGKGSRFRVYLPACSETHTAEKNTETLPLPRGQGELVLVVDDEAAVRQMTRQTLETFGYRVVLASDGIEATSMYAAHKEEISVVLTDMKMPAMDGPTTIQELQKINPQVRIIAASGLNADGLITKTVNAGIKHFIPKPYTAEALLTILRDMLTD